MALPQQGCLITESRYNLHARKGFKALINPEHKYLAINDIYAHTEKSIQNDLHKGLYNLYQR